MLYIVHDMSVILCFTTVNIVEKYWYDLVTGCQVWTSYHSRSEVPSLKIGTPNRTKDTCTMLGKTSMVGFADKIGQSLLTPIWHLGCPILPYPTHSTHWAYLNTSIHSNIYYYNCNLCITLYVLCNTRYVTLYLSIKLALRVQRVKHHTEYSL